MVQANTVERVERPLTSVWETVSFHSVWKLEGRQVERRFERFNEVGCI